MSEYIKQNFTKGQTLKADHLNHMEDGIASVAERINGLSGGAGADWNENDPTSAFYVQNRTHWVEIIEGNAEFDGDLTGREFVQAADDMYFVKMSSTFLTEQELIGQTIKMYTPVEIQEAVIEESSIMKEEIDEDNYVIVLYNVVYNIKGDLSSMGFPLTEGVWFMCQINPDDPSEKAYVMSLSGLTGDVEFVHQIDKKFIPEGVGMPVVTAEDEGKFLRVMEGKAAWVMLGIAEEATFGE